jgi:hypothetical protein
VGDSNARPGQLPIHFRRKFNSRLTGANTEARQKGLLSPSSRSYWFMAGQLGRGVYADIKLGADKRSVVKVVRAPRDGKDWQRVPHNIVLELEILRSCTHRNARCS